MTNLKHVVIVKKNLLIIKQPQRRCFSSKCFISLSLFGFCFFPTPICCVPFLLLFVFFWLSNEKYSETKTKTAFGIFPIKSTFWVSSLFLKKSIIGNTTIKKSSSTAICLVQTCDCHRRFEGPLSDKIGTCQRYQITPSGTNGLRYNLTSFKGQFFKRKK